MSKRKQRKRVEERKAPPPHVAPPAPKSVVVVPEDKKLAADKPLVHRMDLGQYRAQLARDRNEPGRIFVNDLGRL